MARTRFTRKGLGQLKNQELLSEFNISGRSCRVKIDGNRVHGTAEMAEPFEAAGTEYRFQAEVDMIQPD